MRGGDHWLHEAWYPHYQHAQQAHQLDDQGLEQEPKELLHQHMCFNMFSHPRIVVMSSLILLFLHSLMLWEPRLCGTDHRSTIGRDCWRRLIEVWLEARVWLGLVLTGFNLLFSTHHHYIFFKKEGLGQVSFQKKGQVIFISRVCCFPHSSFWRFILPAPKNQVEFFPEVDRE